MAGVILVTNDDGVHAPGLAALAAALEPLGEVYVIAPDREQSAVGHALTLHRPLRVETLGERRFAVNGTPSDCVNLGVLGLLPETPVLVRLGHQPRREPGRRRDVFGDGVGGDGGHAPRSARPWRCRRSDPDSGVGFEAAGRGGAGGGRAAPGRGPAGADAAQRERAAEREPQGIRMTRLGHRVYSEKAIRERWIPRGRPYYWIGAGPPVWAEDERIGHRGGACRVGVGDAAASGPHASRRACAR